MAEQDNVSVQLENLTTRDLRQAALEALGRIQERVQEAEKRMTKEDKQARRKMDNREKALERTSLIDEIRQTPEVRLLMQRSDTNVLIIPKALFFDNDIMLSTSPNGYTLIWLERRSEGIRPLERTIDHIGNNEMEGIYHGLYFSEKAHGASINMINKLSRIKPDEIFDKFKKALRTAA